MSNPDLPFTAEYAKTNRASCKGCKENIGKDSLRVGVMVQSQNFDGKIPLWHHLRCFFAKQNIPSVTDIANFDNLRWEDQTKIKENIAKGSKGIKKNPDFSIEYAKSSRAACRTCNEKIVKGEIRISKLIKDGESARYGPCPGWRHVDCFAKDRLELEFPDSGDKLPGFDKLGEDDKKVILGKIGKLAIKRKADEMPDVPCKKLKKPTKEEELIKAQNDLLFELRDKFKKHLTRQDLITLLKYNNQHISPGEHNNRDNLSDCLVFGAIKTCPECKSTSPRYKIDAYRCSGNVTEWTKCQYVTRCPEREPFKIPEEFKEEYDFLRDYKYVQRDRILPEKADSNVTVVKGPLSGYIFSAFGRFKGPKSGIEKQIMEFGGAISQKVDNSISCCISTESEVKKNNKKVKSANKFDIHIVSEKIIQDIKNGSTFACAIKDNLICSWGGDPILKFGIKKENDKSQAASSSSSSSKSSNHIGKSKTMKVSVQGGAAVDPDSGKAHTSHVFQKKGNIYNCVLGMVNISRRINTYYKLQILESNKASKYWLFRSWGRVGTTIGNNRLEEMPDAFDAVKMFEFYYLDKTGNEWRDRKNFVKQPGLFYPLDIDYGQENTKITKELKLDSDCKLPKPVQELICLIFDIEAMKKAMVEFEIDLQKMPLGKLSKKQIETAYSVLNEAQQIIEKGCNAIKILDASNRFYTLIPHDFGLRTPPLLDNVELIKLKIEMLDSLLEIEFAYNLLQSDSNSKKDQLSEHYEKLKTDIDVIDKKSEEFEIIKKYVKNTHAESHNYYDLVLNKVFKINRHGENERYEKFNSLHNKKLLWHGSRLTNFVGILSQGLRIAPPEAPATGYMFGKGIYFADMVSKSANYCFTSKKNPTGLLLLCEVALGNMYERSNADYITKLPQDKHSTKGMGVTIPDPKEVTQIGDVEVPYGKPVSSKVSQCALLYNEYIVYDVSQVNIKYLLEVDFKWKY